MINRIIPQLSIVNKNTPHKKEITTDKNTYSQKPLMDKDFANSYKSYAINFTGNDPIKKVPSKEEIIHSYATESADDLIMRAKEIANKNGQPVVNHYHILKAILTDFGGVIKELDDGTVDYEMLNKNHNIMLLENFTTPTILSNKDSRKKAKKVIQKKLKELDLIIKKTPKEEHEPNSFLSKELVNDILSSRNSQTEPIEDFHIVRSALFSISKDNVRKFTNSILFDLNDALMLETRPIKDRPHFRRYDDKAKDIWKNLSLGTNMYVTFDNQKTTPEYFIPSLYHVLENEPKGFGRLNKNNIDIVEINTAIKSNYLIEKIKTLANDKLKTHVVIMYPSNMLMNSASQLDIQNKNIAYPPAYVKLMHDTPNNVKFIMFDTRDNLYAQIKNPVIQRMYQNFEEATIPVLSTEDVIKEFKEQPLLRKDIKKPFTKVALEKTVEASAQLDGIFPDKSVRLMKKIVSYYINKREINEKDVAEYVKAAKDLFKKTNDDSSVDIIFDTGIRIKDIIGKEATKKEAMSIVRQIKSNKMGTKGLVLYSLDPMAGSGRKFTAQAIAGEAKVPYVEINANYFGSENVNIFGDGKELSPESAIKKVFSLVTTQADANPNKSAVLFIDKFDNFILGEYLNRFQQRAMAQLINEMEKAEKQGLNILVAGSITRAQVFTEAARNSVKFSNGLEVTTPAFSSKEREEVIKNAIKQEKIKLAAKTPEEKDQIIKSIAATTVGFPFTHLKNFVNRAQTVALERGRKTVEKNDFIEAYLQISTGRPAAKYIEPHEKMLTAAHECGHAVNLEVMNSLIKKMGKPWQLPDKVNFITLDPRGLYGGAMYHRADKNAEGSFEKYFSNIVCAYGGNSAEHQFFGMDGSVGISQDLKQATQLAETMVTKMGLGKNTGKIYIDNDEKALSPERRLAVDYDTSVILRNAGSVSDFITDAYSDFNKQFVEKYADFVGTGDCLIDGKVFREELANWKASLPQEKQDELDFVDKTIWEVMQKTKKGLLY